MCPRWKNKLLFFPIHLYTRHCEKICVLWPKDMIRWNNLSVCYFCLQCILFLNMFLSSSSCHSHHGSGHNSQCSLQLAQQIPAHYHDVKQCEYGWHSYITVTEKCTQQYDPNYDFFLGCFFSSLWRSRAVCSRSLRRTTFSRCQTAVRGELYVKQPNKGHRNHWCFNGL